MSCVTALLLAASLALVCPAAGVGRATAFAGAPTWLGASKRGGGALLPRCLLPCTVPVGHWENRGGMVGKRWAVGLRVQSKDGMVEGEGLGDASAEPEDLGFKAYQDSGADRLLKLLKEGDVASEDGRQDAIKKITELEQLRTFPVDPSFFGLCVSGEWDLAYCTSRVGTPNEALKLRKISASIDAIDAGSAEIPGSGQLVHKIEWEFSEAAEEGGAAARDTKGVFEVKCAYNLSEVPSVPTRMIIGVEEMRLTCEPVNKTPRDPQQLISCLQAALPREFFDPNEALMDTTYMDPNVRVVCFLGMKFAGVRHVYVREKCDELTSALSESSVD